MPKNTFYNLPDKKRQLIEKTAISEFAEFGYDKASITRIVEGCSIAKGSFYQYFDDKKDLFFYLVSRIGEKKLEALSPVMQKGGEYDFFTLIRELFLAGLKFASDNPELSLIGDWLFKNKGHPVYNEIVGIGLQSAQNIYTSLLESAILKGEVRDDMDLGFISHSISSMNYSAIEYYLQTRHLKEIKVEKFDKKMIDTIDLLIDFIKNGIGITKKGGSDND